MHYSIDCYVAKALPVKYQITFMHGMYSVAKTRFVRNSTSSLQKCSIA